jgi:hypothetical protein
MTPETAPRPQAETPDAAPAAWTARRVLVHLRRLNPLRVISWNGPSVFETICDLAAFGVADGHMNAITPQYHWHLRLDGLGHLRSRDEIHERSGRRVLYVEMRESAQADPFLLVYLHRGKGEDFGAERERLFAELHAAFAAGRALPAATEDAAAAGTANGEEVAS